MPTYYHLLSLLLLLSIKGDCSGHLKRQSSVIDLLNNNHTKLFFIKVVPNPNQQVLTQPLKIGLWVQPLHVSNSLHRIDIKGVGNQYKKF